MATTPIVAAVATETPEIAAKIPHDTIVEQQDLLANDQPMLEQQKTNLFRNHLLEEYCSLKEKAVLQAI